ncbi:hypothetical protein B1207_02450 [Legionella quinlivanii]|uniref:Uncharacterized protein n=1 Tax=Legionella quinlivanii TaxID=45073 RepID=A0A364LLX0_9GAMM|nr:hypothetical protein [Legionella quinlivanii]RAP37868.1 hypothetical protein B1207_02450 [Legionella quinlivanii]
MPSIKVIISVNNYQKPALLNMLNQFYSRLSFEQKTLNYDYYLSFEEANVEADNAIERCFGPHLKFYYAAATDDENSQLNQYANIHAQYIHNNIFRYDPALNELKDDSYENSSFKNGPLVKLPNRLSSDTMGRKSDTSQSPSFFPPSASNSISYQTNRAEEQRKSGLNSLIGASIFGIASVGALFLNPTLALVLFGISLILLAKAIYHVGKSVYLNANEESQPSPAPL